MEGHHFLFYGTRSFPTNSAQEPSIRKRSCSSKVESIKESCSSPFSRVGQPYGAFSLVSIRPYDLLQVR
uniref:Uncharacterized protein n=1 Tax=Picea glauca TaxID=3330 RepID=A0A101M2E9_PICGL|nr:hypothetical protein ABT39_MTgene2920 [Picea glauca]QHR87853.1 hypothetical protein Q903MT_gene1865 [Picea sitchensis]